MPVTARQQEQAQQIAHLGNQIDQALPLMPGIENQQVQQRVLDILARDDFHRSGDHVYDLRRAHAVVQNIAQQERRVAYWAASELQKMPPELARAVEHTILYDKRFQQAVARNNEHRFGDETALRENFQMAVGWAQANRRAVAKAKRAAPVKSSSGALAASLSADGLDAHISRALNNWK
jgi:hypothetical protein